jgi:hypothetical protein
MENLLFATFQDGKIVFSNQRELEQLAQKAGKRMLWVKFGFMTKQRTMSQNNALHLYCKMLADELNAAGFTVQLVLKEKIELEWDTSKVKELLWRPTQQAITGKKSTVDLDKMEDIDKVYEHLNRHISEKFGIHVAFPSQATK